MVFLQCSACFGFLLLFICLALIGLFRITAAHMTSWKKGWSVISVQCKIIIPKSTFLELEWQWKNKVLERTYKAIILENYLVWTKIKSFSKFSFDFNWIHSCINTSFSLWKKTLALMFWFRWEAKSRQEYLIYLWREKWCCTGAAWSYTFNDWDVKKTLSQIGGLWFNFKIHEHGSRRDNTWAAEKRTTEKLNPTK